LYTIEDLHGTNTRRLFARFKHDSTHEEDDLGMNKILFKNQKNTPMVHSKKKRYFKRKKQLNLEPLQEKTLVSSFTIKTRRKRKLITLAHVQKNRSRKRKFNLQQLQQQQQQDDRKALIRIRHQMLDFEIPAGWTCISSKANNSSTSSSR
jgi:hypothetical protein